MLTLTLVATLVQAVPALAAPGEDIHTPFKARQETPVPVRKFSGQGPPLSGAPKAPAPTAKTTTWPAAGVTEVDLPAAAARSAQSGRVKAGTLPVAIGASEKPTGVDGKERAVGAAPARVRVEVLDAKADKTTVEAMAAKAKGGMAGRQRVIVRVGRADGIRARGAVSMELDYSGFRDVYGGDWAARLNLVALPECALTTPDKAECRGMAVPTRNDVVAGKLVADVDAGAAGADRSTPTGTLYAAEAAAAGPTGDWSATPLSPSGTWTAGGSSGNFTWSYPMRMPPSLGGVAPTVALSYSSQSVDGLTSGTNTQPSWIGQGFDFSMGFIERKYKACADDTSGSNNPTKTGDLCWGTDNATLSLGDKGGDLVRHDGDGSWHLRNDDGSKIEHIWEKDRNADNDGEYWKITTPDGTQYFFGSRRAANSVWTVPVFGNHVGEPCYNATFDSGYCSQAWRWSLDHVVDRNGNTMTLAYHAESNHYGRNLSETKTSSYVRGGALMSVEYGQRDGHAATARVNFELAMRCTHQTNCNGYTQNWPDTPWDRWCGSEKCSQFSPTFWTHSRLNRVLSQVSNGSGGWRDVESWTLHQTYPGNGDTTKERLWLDSITHTGHVGGSASLPQVKFAGVQMNNRVDAANGPNMNWWRLRGVTSEAGGQLVVTYSGADCAPGSMPGAPDSNTRLCQPVIRQETQTTTKLEWFHKYVVKRIDETGNLQGDRSVSVVHNYEYDGAPAWHYDDDDGIVPAHRKTWGQWRGYGKVRVKKGSGHDGPIGLTETTYFRGMDGDKLANGSRRSATVTDSENVAVVDHEALAGTVRESRTFNGAAEVSGKISDPWTSNPSAYHNRPWWSVRAYLTGTAKERSRVKLWDGNYRRTEVQNTYDDKQGLIKQVNDLGNVADAGDNRCTRTAYSQNASKMLLAFPSRVETVATDCGTTAKLPDEFISDVRSFYDGNDNHGAAPSVGNVTRTEIVGGWVTGGGGPVYKTATRAQYDAYGRVTSAWNAKGEQTTTEFTPAAGGPVTATKVTNPLGHAATTIVEPAWGAKVGIIDANGKKAELELDPLGRTTKVWAPGRTRGTDSPNVQYEYLIRNNGPSAVTTRKLMPGGSYLNSWALFDGMLRPRQTQATAPGGTVVSESVYDSRGLAQWQNGPYLSPAMGGPELMVPDETNLPAQTIRVFDGAARVTAEIFKRRGTELWRTSTTYGGDRVRVDPPSGSPPTQTLQDARGNTIELRQYQPGGGYDWTRYGYDKAGRLASVVDPAGNTWKYGYDLRGRKTSSEDPDKGKTTYGYDEMDLLTSSTDSRGTSLHTAYDKLGRKTELREGTAAGALRAKWTYDSLAKGQPSSSTRYVGADAYVSEVTGYDAGYRPTGTRVTIPAIEGKLARSYETTASYNGDGSPGTTGLPAIGNLPSETLKYGYNGYGMPSSLLADTQSGPASYVREVDYTPYGEPWQFTLGERYKSVWLSYEFEEGTRRLSHAVTDREADGATQGDVRYLYDPAGNMIYMADTPSSYTGVPADTQCFRYDYLRRMRDAWTPANHSCSAEPANPGIGGPAPYWHSYAYDKTGSRATEVKHSSAGDTTRTYTYPAAGQPQPHTLKTVTTKNADGSSRLDEYAYDAAGNTISRKLTGADQRHEWDPEGRVSKITEADGKTTQNVYDAEGTRLIRRDSAGATLYVAGMEIRWDKASDSVSGARYYSQAGKQIAVRNGSNISWLSPDHHGTGHLAIAAGTLDVTRRRTTAFGEERGTLSAWPDQRGFVNGVKDPTGLTRLGARDYDQTTGRFTSVDPVIDFNDPQQMHGYAYSNSNPASMSDEDGLLACNRRDPDDVCPGQKLPGEAPESGGSDRRESPGNEKDEPATIGKRVVVHKSDPNYSKLKEAYELYSSWRYCFWLCSEEKIWGEVCLNTGVCPKEFSFQVSLEGQLTGDGPFHGGIGKILLGTVGTGADGEGFVRSLKNPRSMIGATEAEVRAMVPEDWHEKPIKKGDGIKFGTPERGNRSFGAQGWVEFNRGDAAHPDPLHRGNFVRVAVGGLQYRAAAVGNPVIEQGAGLQMTPGTSGNPGKGLDGAKDLIARRGGGLRPR